MQILATLLAQKVADLVALEDVNLQGKATGEAIWNGLGGLMQIGKLKRLG